MRRRIKFHVTITHIDKLVDLLFLPATNLERTIDESIFLSFFFLLNDKFFHFVVLVIEPFSFTNCSNIICRHSHDDLSDVNEYLFVLFAEIF